MPATAPYVTPDALVAAFGEREIVELTDRDTPRAGEVDTAVAQRACDRAIAEINGHLRARYRLPLSAVPELVFHLARDLARYYLYDLTEPPTVVKTRFDLAQKTLLALQRGEQPLGVDALGGDVADAPQDLPEFAVGDKTFGRSSSW